jgi:hypothetical protein
MHAQELGVVHVAAVGDEQALESLCRTTPVVAAAGVRQVLLAIDDGCGADLAWAAAVVAEVRPLRCSGMSILGRVRALQREFLKLAREQALYAVHLHGVAPCLLGSRALKGSLPHVRVLCSPYGTQFGSRWCSGLVGRLLRNQLSRLNHAALAASLAEAPALSKLLNRSAEVLPHPVSDVYFAASRNEGMRSSVLVQGEGAAVDVATRLCVLLNGREPRVPFSWLGMAQPGARAQLEAADVRLLKVADDTERVQWLSSASAFIHISSRNEVPSAVAQAMAAGVPCLVSDTPAHRALIRHGETGFVCTSERDYLEKLVHLLRDRAERSRIGEAARAEAGRCFTLRHFERAILRAYGFSAGKPFHAPRAAGLPSPVSRVH